MRKVKKIAGSVIVIFVALGLVSAYIPLLFAPKPVAQEQNIPEPQPQQKQVVVPVKLKTPSSSATTSVPISPSTSTKSTGVPIDELQNILR